MDLKTNDLILFTGAGFSKNFGGFLGKEMWAKIFNYPNFPASGDKEIDELLLNHSHDNFNFENIYSEVLDDDKYDTIQKNRIIQSVEYAYKLLDISIRRPERRLYSIFVKDILPMFFDKNEKKGIWFTLNQDILIERLRIINGEERSSCGMAPFGRFDGELRINQYQTLPTEYNFEQLTQEVNSSNQIAYIKLHGSYGWLFSSMPQHAMAIGVNKMNIINSEPLLKTYFELFENVLKEGGKKMLIIGYGFNDDHINDILIEAAQEYGLKLYIWTTQSIDSFYKSILDSPKLHNGIWPHIIGFFPYSFQEVWSSERIEHPIFNEIKMKLDLDQYYEDLE